MEARSRGQSRQVVARLQESRGDLIDQTCRAGVMCFDTLIRGHRSTPTRAPRIRPPVQHVDTEAKIRVGLVRSILDRFDRFVELTDRARDIALYLFGRRPIAALPRRGSGPSQRLGLDAVIALARAPSAPRHHERT
jgi:hypothetical protein